VRRIRRRAGPGRLQPGNGDTSRISRFFKITLGTRLWCCETAGLR
jgi:hypothetical protein